MTASDQWIPKILLWDDRRTLEEHPLVPEVMGERPTQVPHDVQGAIRKLVLVGALQQEESGGYRVNAFSAMRLKGVLPDRPRRKHGLLRVAFKDEGSVLSTHFQAREDVSVPSALRGGRT